MINKAKCDSSQHKRICLSMTYKMWHRLNSKSMVTEGTIKNSILYESIHVTLAELLTP